MSENRATFSPQYIIVHERKSAYVTLFLGGVCLGVAPVVVKAIGLPAEVTAFYRVAIAAPVFLLWAIFQQPQAPEMGPKAVAAPKWLYVLASLLFSADLFAMHYAIGSTTVATATLLTNCAPFFVGLLGLMHLTERPTRQFWRALPLALVGTALLIGATGLTGIGNASGDFIALGAAAFYAGYLVAVKELRRRGATPAWIMATVTIGTGLTLAPAVAWTGLALPREVSTWMLIMTLALIGQVAGQGFVTIALRSLPVSSSSLVLLIQPVIAGIISWVMLGEILDFIQILGIGIVLLSIYLSLRPK